jgi:hypothetical protein
MDDSSEDESAKPKKTKLDSSDDDEVPATTKPTAQPNLIDDLLGMDMPST